MKQQFDGKQDKELPPTHHDEKIVFEMVRNISVIFEKLMKGKRKRRENATKQDVPFKKQSIFFR
jgi:hypothetical protein